MKAEFLTEKKARDFQSRAEEHGYCTNYYRYVRLFVLVYVVEYWK